jgi:hypothetical protein
MAIVFNKFTNCCNFRRIHSRSWALPVTGVFYGFSSFSEFFVADFHLSL